MARWFVIFLFVMVGVGAGLHARQTHANRPFSAYRSGDFCVFVTFKGDDIAVIGPVSHHTKCN